MANTYTGYVVGKIDERKNEILKYMAINPQQTIIDVEEYWRTRICVPYADMNTNKQFYLMHAFGEEDSPKIARHVRHKTVARLLDNRAAILTDTAHKVDIGVVGPYEVNEYVAMQKTKNGIGELEDITQADMSKFDEWDELHRWAMEAVYYDAWHEVFGPIVKERIGNMSRTAMETVAKDKFVQLFEAIENSK